jgi:HD-like signal output (HDOD) protein
MHIDLRYYGTTTLQTERKELTLNDIELFSYIEQRLDNQELVLPTLPDVAFEANDLLADENVEIDDIVYVIKKDQGIAASVVKFANSALVRGNQKITSIEQATIRIGLKRLRNVIMTSAVAQIFFAKDVSFAIQLTNAWSQSTDVAISTGATINYLKSKGTATHIDHDTLFLAALVHNIGLLPIFTEADRLGKSLDKKFLDRDFVNKVIESKGRELTKRVLREWKFDESLITTAYESRNLNYQTNDVSMTDILRLGMTNTDVISDNEKEAIIKTSKSKGLIKDKSWKSSNQFIDELLKYKDLF